MKNVCASTALSLDVYRDAIDAAALLYLEQSGINTDQAIAMIIGATANPIISRLPMEFLVESKQLIQMAIHGE